MTRAAVTCILQARMGSQRLPGKSMEEINGVPVIEIVLRRLAKAGRVARIVLATSDHGRDDVLADRAAALGFAVYRGHETDLVARFVGAARAYAASDYLLRATGDNVFMDWEEVDRIATFGASVGYDFVGWRNPRFPDRSNDFAVEFLNRSALERVAAATQDPSDREHVFPYFQAHPELFRVARLAVPERLMTAVKLDLDYPEDLDRLRAIARHFSDPVAAHAAEIVRIANHLSVGDRRKAAI